MTPAQYLACRNAYAYPAVGLNGCLASYAHRTFASIRSMEDHHRALLRSPDDATAVFGYLSVIYWGHYSGQDGVVRGPRSLGKVLLAKDGMNRKRKGCIERVRGVADIGVSTVGERIRQATSLVDEGHFGDALKILSCMPQLNFAFASKVCAFLLPESCGVIDSVIAASYRRFGFEVDSGGYVRKNNTNATNYTSYCEFLSNEAQVLNLHGVAYMWRDLDGTLCPWRAVDVERALYRSKSSAVADRFTAGGRQLFSAL
jgi:hypothetical protein